MFGAAHRHVEQPLLNIVGEKVALGPFERENARLLNAWYNDYSVMRTWEFLPGPRVLDQVEQALDTIFKEQNTEVFSIYELSTQKVVGFCVLIHIDHVNGIAEFGIMIGEIEAQGKGYGTEATQLLLDHGFTALGLNNIILRVFEYNLAGIRAYEKVGFRQMGIRHNSKVMGGRLWDTIYMEALADDFDSPVLADILKPDVPR